MSANDKKSIFTDCSKELVYKTVVVTEASGQGATQIAAHEKNYNLRHTVVHDPLTGLHSRAFLQKILPRLIELAMQHNEKLALLFIDIDNFKNLNNALGYSIGDMILKEVAGRIKKVTSVRDFVVRVGGDDFMVILNQIKDILEVVSIADRILSAVSKDMNISGHSFTVQCSIGVSVFPRDAVTSDALIKNAELAFYSAKEKNRGAWTLFDRGMGAKAIERFTLEKHLRHAVDNDQLFLEFQPQVQIATGKIICAEALLRWHHPDAGVISPSIFIPAAEKSGEIIRIGAWVLRAACSQAKAWADIGLNFPVAVNVSVAQFRHSSFLELVRESLHQANLDPSLLEIEITESLLISNFEEVSDVSKKLKEIGVRISIDDFGAGYCGLSYIRYFNPVKIKIDRVFIDLITSDKVCSTVTSAIVNIAHALRMEVLAEGVETAEQLIFLKNIGCHHAQGFYFSPAVSADRLSAMVQAGLFCSEQN